MRPLHLTLTLLLFACEAPLLSGWLDAPRPAAMTSTSPSIDLRPSVAAPSRATPPPTRATPPPTRPTPTKTDDAPPAPRPEPLLDGLSLKSLKATEGCADAACEDLCEPDRGCHQAKSECALPEDRPGGGALLNMKTHP